MATGRDFDSLGAVRKPDEVLVLDEAGLAAALMSAVVGFVFAAVYFWLLDRFADQILIWIAILIGLPALMVVARLQLLASTGSG